MDEFSLIKHYFASHATHNSSELDLGIGDDCAIFHLKNGEQMVVTTDTLVSGVHFFENASPYSIGWKSLAVNLSDLAAMGATAKYFTLALTLPANIQTTNPSFLPEFSSGLSDLANKYHIDLIGGDTTHGPLSITITAMGTVPTNQAITRSSAKANDDIYVTGSLGGAALAVKLLYENKNPPKECQKLLDFPEPRIDIGLQLRGIATSMLDLSDGLGSDLEHILKRSNCSALIELDKLPIQEDLKNFDENDVIKNHNKNSYEKDNHQLLSSNTKLDAHENNDKKLFCDGFCNDNNILLNNPHNLKYKLALFGGDDYELCFTAPSNDLVNKKIQEISNTQGILITKIGKILDHRNFDVKGLNQDSLQDQVSTSSFAQPVDHMQIPNKANKIFYKLSNKLVSFADHTGGYNHFS